jgi:flagellar biosynthesis/type III secretory pathway chaperone
VVEQVLHQAHELHRLLTMEFEELLGQLGTACPDPQALQSEPCWQDLREELLKCRDLHRRNAIFIERKLDTIRGALHCLRSGDSGSPLEVYDRLGQVARFSRARGYQEV